MSGYARALLDSRADSPAKAVFLTVERGQR